MSILIALNILMSLILAIAATLIWLPPRIHEGVLAKLGLGTLTIGLLFGAFALANDPSPYGPTMVCWAAIQFGALVACAGLALRVYRHKDLRQAVKAVSGYTPLDEAPPADRGAA